jgi:diguanylate cyclase (GGDEF)-like protein
MVSVASPQPLPSDRSPWRAVGVLVLIASLAIASFAIAVTVITRIEVRTQINEGLKADAGQIAAAIGQRLSDDVPDVQAIAHEKAVVAAATAGHPLTDGQLATVAEALQARGEGIGVIVIAADGKVLGRIGSVDGASATAAPAWVTAALRIDPASPTPYATSDTSAATAPMHYGIAVPISDGHRARGAVGISGALPSLPAPGLQSADAYVVDHSGNQVILGANARPVVLTRDEVSRAVQQDHRGDVITDGDDLITVATVAGVGWSVVVGTPQKVALQGVGHVDLIVIAMTLVFLGVFSVVLFFLARAIRRQGAAEALLVKQATHDTLTGLANRALFHEQLERALAQAVRSGRPVAVIAIDLNDFKGINDRHGHHAGDLFLESFAARLLGAVRAGDLPARVGGDEFVVLAPDTGREDGTLLVDRLRSAIAVKHDIGSTAVPGSAAFGLAVSPDDGESGDALLQAADERMYLDKQSKPSRGGRASKKAAEPGDPVEVA